MNAEPRVTWAGRLQQAWLSRGALALALLPLAALFVAVTAVRRGLYRIGWLPTHRVSAPVIVVGNLVAGGAGKTPTVIAVVAALRRHGYTPGIVSRGYGVPIEGLLDVTRDLPAARCGDEPLLLHLRTGAPVVVGRDRVGAARHLLLQHPAVDVIVSDDGLQHQALARDVQVLVFDERGAGNGWLLPAGPLREPLPRGVPPRSLVLYNAPAPSTPLPGTLARRSLAGVVPLADWWQGRPASMAALEALRGCPLIAAAGLARPQRFFEMLRDSGLTITPQPLPDHHGYATLPWPADAADVVVTEKDAIKLRADRIGATRVWVAPLDFSFDAAFEAALIALLPLPGPRHGNTPA
ncbi:MAG TPA: tetraacyldisaccharide 4'-kinase [Burkholderiaceae bacterium]